MMAAESAPSRPASSSRHFANWLLEYMRFTRHSEAPDSLHFWTGVSTIAGALRRRVWIDEEIFQWTPNFYIIFVAPPGIATKSTSIDLGARLLRRIDGVHFGPDSMTWQGLTVALQEAQEVLELPTDDEDLGLMQMSCITCTVSELGTFLKARDIELMNVLTDLWDGKIRPWRHRIKTGDKPETLIINPWINIVGATTPSWFRSNFTQEMLEGGLVSRCIFIYASTKRRLVPYPSREIKPEDFFHQQELLVEDLQQISALCGQYELTPEAIEWGERWYEQHWGPQPPQDVGDRYSGYLARKQTHIHKLAMVIAASKRDELYINDEDLAAADRCISGTESDTQKLFRKIGSTNFSRQTQDIYDYIAGLKACTYRALWRVFMPYMQKQEFDQALEGLISAGLIATAHNEQGEKTYVALSKMED